MLNKLFTQIALHSNIVILSFLFFLSPPFIFLNLALTWNANRHEASDAQQHVIWKITYTRGSACSKFSKENAMPGIEKNAKPTIFNYSKSLFCYNLFGSSSAATDCAKISSTFPFTIVVFFASSSHEFLFI